MIKAIILIHLWSLVLASIAWVLQLDNGHRIGSSFPSPRIWFSLIGLSFLPGVLCMLPVSTTSNLLNIEIYEIFPNALDIKSTDNPWALNYLAVYMILVLLLMTRTIFLWSRLQFLHLISTDESDVFITSSSMPPLTLSWPRRAIVIPAEVRGEAALIRHERAHLRHHDAEMTLCLLLLQDLMLRSPGISYLVRQWRLAIELRADHAATKMLNTSERKDYAALLLSGLRSGGHHTDGRTLPCPTAHLTSTRHRSVKMRLTEIMENKSNPRKHRWSAALLLATLGAGMIGFISTSATAKDDNLTIQADKIITDEIVYIKRVPPIMPASCPGLNLDGIEITGRDIKVKGEVVQQHAGIVGTVALKYDVRPDGSTHNLRIVKSNHPCFESVAKASVAQWMIERQDKDVRDVAVILKFMLTGETHEDLGTVLNDFIQ